MLDSYDVLGWGFSMSVSIFAMNNMVAALTSGSADAPCDCS